MSRKIKLLLGVIGAIIVAVAVWFLVLQPTRSDIASTEKKLESMRMRLQAAQTKLAQAETKRQEARYNQARLLELAKMVPENEEIPSLIVELEALARESGVKLSSITPGETSELTGLNASYVPVDLQLSGSYFDLGDFVYRLEQMVARPGRLLAVKTVNLETESAQEEVSPGHSPTLRATITVYAFVARGGKSTSSSPAATTAGTGETTTTTSQ